MTKLKKIPKFKTLAEEAIFWEQHNSADYIDWIRAKRANFLNLKPSTNFKKILVQEVRDKRSTG